MKITIVKNKGMVPNRDFVTDIPMCRPGTIEIFAKGVPQGIVEALARMGKPGSEIVQRIVIPSGVKRVRGGSITENTLNITVESENDWATVEPEIITLISYWVFGVISGVEVVRQ